MVELEMRQFELLPETEEAFTDAVLDAHRTLFKYVLPTIAGRFRAEGEEVIFGGTGANKREGCSPEAIADGMRLSFRMATNREWTVVRRSAAFLESFFRIHPFVDGNGRIGRFFVQKICRGGGKVVPFWNTEGKSRRRYIAALEYAHRHWLNHGQQSLVYLERWLHEQIKDAPDDDGIADVE